MNGTPPVNLPCGRGPCPLLGASVLTGGVGCLGTAAGLLQGPPDFLIGGPWRRPGQRGSWSCYESRLYNLPLRGHPPAREQPTTTSENPQGLGGSWSR